MASAVAFLECSLPSDKQANCWTAVLTIIPHKCCLSWLWGSCCWGWVFSQGLEVAMGPHLWRGPVRCCGYWRSKAPQATIFLIYSWFDCNIVSLLYIFWYRLRFQFMHIGESSVCLPKALRESRFLMISVTQQTIQQKPNLAICFMLAVRKRLFGESSSHSRCSTIRCRLSLAPITPLWSSKEHSPTILHIQLGGLPVPFLPLPRNFVILDNTGSQWKRE